jgi:hypothetical protein
MTQSALADPTRPPAGSTLEETRRRPRTSVAGAIDESGIADLRLCSSKLHTSAELCDANQQF